MARRRRKLWRRRRAKPEEHLIAWILTIAIFLLVIPFLLPIIVVWVVIAGVVKACLGTSWGGGLPNTPAGFEEWCAAELRAAGWRADVTRQSGDQGVDVIAHSSGLTMAVQCKLYSKSVGNKAVQEVFTGQAFYGADIAVVVASAGFTPSARDVAGRVGVHLVDAKKFRAFAQRYQR